MIVPVHPKLLSLFNEILEKVGLISWFSLAFCELTIVAANRGCVGFFFSDVEPIRVSLSAVCEAGIT